MSIHTVTRETTVTSEVEVLAPPGVRTESVVRIAEKEMDRVFEHLQVTLPPADLYVSRPIYEEGRKWTVNITAIFRTTNIVHLKD